jgi:hypothetical protein
MEKLRVGYDTNDLDWGYCAGLSITAPFSRKKWKEEFRFIITLFQDVTRCKKEKAQQMICSGFFSITK